MSSLTLAHPDKAVGRNEMPFGRDTRVVPRNTVLDRCRGPLTGRGDLEVGTPVRSDAAYRQITLLVVVVVVVVVVVHNFVLQNLV